ncbi:hypothetical protein KW800_00800 [Candidatus Parcubacteria bacterium]|nr:hypothetical protein [Candidatus Parcubacteria bacterium]
MSFFDLFPAPKYMNLAEAGVSVEGSIVRYISLSPFRYGEMSLDKFKAMGFHFVSVAIPDDKAYVFNIKVESATYKDLGDAVASTVEENAPVKLATSVHSFEYEGEPSAEGKSIPASVSVLPLDVAESYAKEWSAAGITPVSYDLRSEAVARALIERGDVRAYLILDLSETKTGLYLVESEMVRFSSTLPIDLSVHTTESMALLKNEIRKVFLFSKDKKIEHVTLTGVGAEDDAFIAELLREVDTPYSVGNVWVNVRAFKHRLPEMPFRESLRYAPAIGALLPPSRQLYV